MDTFDEELINELRRGGYQRISDLATRLGKNQRTVQRRFNVLKNKGIIRIIAIPNPVLSEFNVWANIGICVKTGTTSAVASQLVNHPSIYFVAYCIGKFNFIITVHFKNLEELTHFVDTELMRTNGITRTETWLIARHRKYYHFNWAGPCTDNDNFSKKSETVVTAEKFPKIDQIDQTILNVLMEDGLLRTKDIARRLDIGETTVRKRIRTMMKNDIFRIEVIPDISISKERVWATIGITTTDNQSAHRIIDAVINEQDLHGVASTFGKYDIVMAGTFHNVVALNDFVNGRLAQIEGINDIDVYILASPLKYYKVN